MEDLTDFYRVLDERVDSDLRELRLSRVMIKRFDTLSAMPAKSLADSVLYSLLSILSLWARPMTMRGISQFFNKPFNTIAQRNEDEYLLY